MFLTLATNCRCYGSNNKTNSSEKNNHIFVGLQPVVHIPVKLSRSFLTKLSGPIQL